jgi:hypothetical protein
MSNSRIHLGRGAMQAASFLSGLAHLASEMMLVSGECTVEAFCRREAGYLP